MMNNGWQTTIARNVTCSGVGVHTGEVVSLRIMPAEADTGIVFKRTDVAEDVSWVPAAYDAVSETTLGTTIENVHGTKVATIEHLMAALWGCGVDNAIIELDGPEVPIMDGSSEPFVFLIECVGTETLDAPRVLVEVLRDVEVKQGELYAKLSPADQFALDITIEFDHAMIGTQRAYYDFSTTSFKQALCRARTFGFASEVEKLRQMGLARGGSLSNAVVLNGDKILNQEGLRYNDEFVRHKALDCVGDYFLAGCHIMGAVETVRPGHGINNQLMRALFADKANYRLVRAVPTAQAEMAAAEVAAVA
ncbi:MAG: UDP-3-O-[3-hydroxymyristoyl] N-acetylglucosamine deacetylase [Rickettsiales bacterium]|nr:UDP-3-O-[3-hydroxymyristoyl] N-acetylglucosamine deacetylase [Rickettsiales bacterium]